MCTLLFTDFDLTRCHVCNKEFTRCNILKQHMEVLNTIKSHKRHLCPNTYKQKASLWRHLNLKHSGALHICHFPPMEKLLALPGYSPEVIESGDQFSISTGHQCSHNHHKSLCCKFCLGPFIFLFSFYRRFCPYIYSFIV